MSEYPLPVEIPELRFFQSKGTFTTEHGHVFPSITIGYHVYGDEDATKPVIWVCHALTANSHVADWWSGLFGVGKLFDPEQYTIICANVIGSCYGSTGPRSIDPSTGESYGMNWPLITIRDWVKAHDLLRTHLGIREIELCIGGSCGGHQVLEFALLDNVKIKNLALIATAAFETPWAVAIHESQRMAMESDPTLFDNTNGAGSKGMEAARGMALLGYRTFDAYLTTQANDSIRITDHKVSSYVRHQGSKLSRRFYAHAYFHLLTTLDTHNISRGRGSMDEVLKSITIPSIVIGIQSDVLIPVSQQQFLHQQLPNNEYHEIPSAFGHDGFLIETDSLQKLISPFIQEKRER